MTLTEDNALRMMNTLATHSVEHIQHFAGETAGELASTLMTIATTPPFELGELTVQNYVVEHLQRATVEALQHQTECEGCK